MEFNATFLITIISFITFTIIMNVILYRPLEKIVDERKELIEKNYSDGESAKLKANSILEKKANELAQAKADAKHSIDVKLKKDYDESSEKLREEKVKSVQYLSEQKDLLKQESDMTEANLSENIRQYAQMIKDKLFGGQSNGF